MASPIELLLRVLGAKAAADDLNKAAAANRDLAAAVAATAPASNQATVALRAEADAAKAAAPQLERVAAAETAAAAAETRVTVARAGHTAEIQRQTVATERLAVASRATTAAAATAANASRGLSTTTRQSLIYTLSDLISTSGAGFSLQRFALQQGPQLVQGALASSTMGLGAMAAYGAGFAVAAAPLIKVLKDLTEIIRLRGDALALTTGTNRVTTTALGGLIEQRRRAGQISEAEARRLLAQNQGASDAQTIEAPSPWMAMLSRVPGWGYAEQKAANERAAREIEARNQDTLRELQAATGPGFEAAAQLAEATAARTINRDLAKEELDLTNAQAQLSRVLASQTATRSERQQAITEFLAKEQASLRTSERLQAALTTAKLAEVKASLERAKDPDEQARLKAEIERLEMELEVAAVNFASRRQSAMQAGNAQLAQETPLGLGEQFDAQWNAYSERIGNWAANLANVLMSPIVGFRDGLAQSLDELIARGGTAGEFFRGIAAGIGASMRRAFVDMVADWVTSHVVMKAVAIAYHGFLKLLRWAGVIDANAAEAAKTPALAANATLASIGSWGIAVAIGLAAIAGILASMGAFADGGMVRGPGGPREDRIMARLSNGEHVTNAASVSRLGERFMAGLNAGVVDLGALAPGANVRGGAGGGLGGAGGGGGGAVNVNTDIKMLGVYESEAATLKALDSVAGRAFLLNFMKGTVSEVTGRG